VKTLRCCRDDHFGGEPALEWRCRDSRLHRFWFTRSLGRPSGENRHGGKARHVETIGKLSDSTVGVILTQVRALIEG
jgi:hypothetical protein